MALTVDNRIDAGQALSLLRREKAGPCANHASYERPVAGRGRHLGLEAHSQGMASAKLPDHWIEANIEPRYLVRRQVTIPLKEVVGPRDDTVCILPNFGSVLPISLLG